MAFYILMDELNSFLKKKGLDTIREFKKQYNIGEMQDAVRKVAQGRIRSMDVEDREAFERAKDGGCEETVIVSEPFGAELFEAILGSECATRKMESPTFTCERLVTMDENKQVKDIYLLYEGDTRYRNPDDYMCEVTDKLNLGVALLYVEMRNLNFNFICYKPILAQPDTPNARDCTTYLFQELQHFIYEKIGLEFDIPENAKKVNDTKCILPITQKTDGDRVEGYDDSVRSACYVCNDVNVPAYISYNRNKDWEQYRSEHDGEKRLKRFGALRTPYGHSVIGFCGYGPHTFYTQALSDVDEAYATITTYATHFNDPRCKIEMVERCEEKSDKSSNTAVFKEVGVVTDIYDGASRGMSEAAYRNAQRNAGHYSRKTTGCHAAHSVMKWEPKDTTPFRLDEVPEVRVSRLVGITEGVPNGETPMIFYVQSESGKWYEYNYFGIEERLKPGKKELLDFEVHGATDDSFFDMEHTEYMFGYLDYDGRWFEHDEANRLKAAGDASKMKIKVTHDKSYLVMQNDMRTVWDLCEQIQNNGII